ncbi:secreted RxLR effector protein 161-like [Bactrocera tryoni]|uniref:secreted RxLR effector protein 161-like n=1 Tax=Bactrocera tryoni TaxID=59916 RepID=UPI001A96523E|nr:secreted RxLR effector protein 161-like [Bactrocera tryoni]
MKNLGAASSVLGMCIAQNFKEGTLKIDQSSYIADVIRRFGMEECNPVGTPLDVNQKLPAEMCPTNDDEKREMVTVPYKQAIGCLLFAAQVTRPDICFAVNLLSRYSTNPGKAHWTAVKRVMCYLKGNIDKGLVYKRSPDEIVGFCDADWANDNAAISWATKRQRTVALSSTEAELMSMVAATQESIWLKRFEKELVPKAS